MTMTMPMSVYERECREFAKEFPTSNVVIAVQFAEAGRLEWKDVHEVLTKALADALAVLREERGDSE